MLFDQIFANYIKMAAKPHNGKDAILFVEGFLSHAKSGLYKEDITGENIKKLIDFIFPPDKGSLEVFDEVIDNINDMFVGYLSDQIKEEAPYSGIIEDAPPMDEEDEDEYPDFQVDDEWLSIENEIRNEEESDS